MPAMPFDAFKKSTAPNSQQLWPLETRRILGGERLVSQHVYCFLWCLDCSVVVILTLQSKKALHAFAFLT